MPESEAKSPYLLTVGGIEVTDENAHDVLGDGGSVVYNAKKNKLTLTNARITDVLNENF